LRQEEPTVVVQKAYEWALWAIPKVEKFPKSYRFSIGQSLVSASIELLMNLVDATYQARNSGSLGAAVREVNRIRYLVRLAKDLRAINLDGYEFASKAIDEVGRMAGGWLKSSRLRQEGKQEGGVERTGNLWPELVSWANLLEATRAAARGKRKRPDVARFLHELEPNLCRLQRELEEGTYRPGGYRTFWIRDPKPRLISAAGFRDRVVHHALTRVLEPVFDLNSAFRSAASMWKSHQTRSTSRGCAWLTLKVSSAPPPTTNSSTRNVRLRCSQRLSVTS
jgi:hypothetical protein